MNAWMAMKLRDLVLLCHTSSTWEAERISSIKPHTVMLHMPGVTQVMGTNRTETKLRPPMN